MNEFDRHASDDWFDAETFDRLVDGELRETEYRELLARCDEDLARGDGRPWRRCALAFLEAQALRRELRGWSAESEAKPLAEMEASVSSPGLSLGWVSLLLASAASFLFAFALAAKWQETWSRSAMAPDTKAIQPANKHDATPQTAIAQAPREAAQDAPGQSSPTWLSAGSVMVTVNAPEGGVAQQVEVPLYRTADGDLPPIWSLESAAPEGLLEALKSTGRRVVHRQRLWPLELDDGRQVLVPVEQVDVTPPNLASFQ